MFTKKEQHTSSNNGRLTDGKRTTQEILKMRNQCLRHQEEMRHQHDVMVQRLNRQNSRKSHGLSHLSEEQSVTQTGESPSKLNIIKAYMLG